MATQPVVPEGRYSKLRAGLSSAVATAPEATPSATRYRNPREALAAQGIVQNGTNNGFWKSIGAVAGIDTSQPGWKRRFRQANPNADPNFLMNIAGGHIKKNKSGGWTGFGRGPGGSGAVVNGVFDASGNAISGDGGGEAGIVDWGYDADLGGAAPGGAGGAGGAGRPGSVASDMDSLIRGLMSGEQGPYTEEVQTGLRGEAQQRRTADILGANRAATLAAARGGSGGAHGASPALQSVLAQNAREGRNALASDVTGIKRDATQANFSARIEGLNQAQQTEQRRFQDKWEMARDDREREQIRLEHEDNLAKLAQEKDLAQQQIGAAGAAAGRGRSWDLEDRQAQWDREDFLFQRNLPFQLSEYGFDAFE